MTQLWPHIPVIRNHTSHVKQPVLAKRKLQQEITSLKTGMMNCGITKWKELWIVSPPRHERITSSTAFQPHPNISEQKPISSSQLSSVMTTSISFFETNFQKQVCHHVGFDALKAGRWQLLPKHITTYQVYGITSPLLSCNWQQRTAECRSNFWHEVSIPT